MKLATICVVLIAFGNQALAGPHGKGKELRPNLPPKAPFKPNVPKPEVVQEVATCYKGYTLLFDGTCMKVIVEEPVPAEGEVIVPYIVRCSEGYVAQEGKCIKVNEVLLGYFCPDEYEDDGFACAKKIPGEIVSVCNEGNLINGSCILSQKVSHIITPKCPEGSTVEKDGNCWKVVETFDCTPKTGKEPEVSGRVVSRPIPPLPLGKKIIVSKGLRRSLHAPKPIEKPKNLPFTQPGKNSIPGELVANATKTTTEEPLTKVATECPKEKEFVSVAPPHPTKVGVASQTCAKKEQVDAIVIISCQEGFEDMGDDCLKETTTKPSSLCLTNGATNGDCPPYIKRVPKVPRCVNGKAPDDNGKCIEVETADPEKVCAEGFNDTGNGCEGTVKSGGLECRPGLTLKDTEEGPRCLGKSVRPSVSLILKPKTGCEDKY